MSDSKKEKILDHYHHPRNFGTLENPEITHKEDNPLCGDWVRIDVHLNDGIVKEVRFEGEGCTISIASASMLTELIQGKSLQELRSLGKESILNALGVTLNTSRQKCALLSLKVFQEGAFGMQGCPGDEDDEDW